MGTDKRAQQKWAGIHATRLARIDWRGWDEEQNRAERLTIFERAHGMTAVDRPENRPVPRRANCHFFGIDSDPRNVYFY